MPSWPTGSLAWPTQSVLPWPAAVAAFVVVLTILYLFVKPRSSRRGTPKEKDDDAAASAFLKYHTIWSFTSWAMRGAILDVVEMVTRVAFQLKDVEGYESSAWRAGPPLFSGWQCFYTKRLYGRIQDCWNRPITGQASRR